MQGVAYAGNLNGFHIDGLSDTKVGFFQDGVYAAASDGGTIYTAQAIQSTIEEVKVCAPSCRPNMAIRAAARSLRCSAPAPILCTAKYPEFGRVSAMQERKYFDEYRFGQLAAGPHEPPSELFQQPNATLQRTGVYPENSRRRNKTFFLFAVERVIEKQGKQRPTQFRRQ